MKPISLLVVDDNITFLDIACRFLEQQEDMSIVGTATSGQEALHKALELKPCVILLDLNLPDVSGFQIIPQLRVALPEMGIIVLSLSEAAHYREAVILTGADELVSKNNMNVQLLPTIRQVVQANLL